MQMLYILVFLNFLLPSIAVICYDNWNNNYCCGDYCYVNRLNLSSIYVDATGCVRGNIYSGFRNKCWNNNGRSFCICDEYHCNYPYSGIVIAHQIADKYLRSWSNKSLTCGDETNCLACEQKLDDGYALKGCKRDRRFTDIESLMQPQSCTRFEKSRGENVIRCLCDTGDNCDVAMASEQKLRSQAVTCYMEASGKRTCKGDLCYIRSSYVDVLALERGCITNNETIYKGLYQTGYTTLTYDYEIVICKTDKCNEYLSTAISSVSMPVTSCPVPAATTRNPYAFPFTTTPTMWTSLVNNLIAIVTGFDG